MNILALFDGMSGGQIALRRAKIKYDEYYASEIDKYVIRVTQDNYPNTVQLGDIFGWRDWKIDHPSLLLAGFPCQPYSIAGSRKGLADSRGGNLVAAMFDVIEFYKPEDALLENVTGLLSIDGGNTLKHILEQLNNIGYAVDWMVINSALVSAQNRKRIYIICKRMDLCESYKINVDKSNKRNYEESLFNINSVIVYDSGINQPEDKGIILSDIIQTDVIPDRNKSLTLTSSYKNNPSIVDYERKLKQLIPVVKKGGELVEKGDKSNCLDANYSKGLDRHQQRTGIAMITNINPSGKGANGIVYDIDGEKAPTITTNKGEGPKVGCIQVGTADGINGTDILKRVYSEEGKAPTLNTCSGGNREPKIAIIEHEQISMGIIEEVKEIEPTKKEESGPIVVDKTYNNRKEREYINKAPTIRKGQTFDVKIKQKARGFNKGGIKEGGKTPPITANSWQENNHLTKNNVLWRKLTPIECERLQTVPDNFSSCVSNSRRYSCLGNGWTVDVIVHLLKGMGL